ncbi:CPBP family intramembrane glutamic endopeptidase [Brevundimonas sp.]
MSPYDHLVSAAKAARHSPMVTDFKVSRPWLRLIGFVCLATLFLFLTMLVLALVVRLIPWAIDPLGMEGALPDTVTRLADESVFVLVLGGILFALALAILAAATVAYGRPSADFLWPGRRFNPWDLGVGFLTMACIGVILFPVYLWTGSEWAPPLFGAMYAEWTRPLYLVATTLGLLVAAAGEEIACRGVLLRLTSQISRHPLVLCLVNGVLFSALHMDPDPVAFVARALSGAIWTWSAIRLGGLEFAIGAHLANNLMITLFWQPLSAMEIGAESHWTALAPELFTAAVVLIIIERLADGPRDWRPARLAPRGAA